MWQESIQFLKSRVPDHRSWTLTVLWTLNHQNSIGWDHMEEWCQTPGATQKTLPNLPACAPTKLDVSHWFWAFSFAQIRWIRESFLMTWPLKGSGGEANQNPWIRESYIHNSTDVKLHCSKLYLVALSLRRIFFWTLHFQSGFWALNRVWMPANRLKRKWKLGGIGGPNNFQTSPKFPLKMLERYKL